MKILKRDVEIAPITFFATLLNAPCSSLLLARESKESKIYLIVGKSNGETVFFPTDRSECVSKFECEAKVPITALCAGDLRNTGKCDIHCVTCGNKVEVVTITSNGLLQSLDFPSGDPTRIFCQQIYANVCSAVIFDIDGDGLFELVVVMTDRVVRSFRYLEEAERLVPLNKWEMPSQVNGWSMGIDGSHQCYAILSQYGQNHYVILDFGASKEVKVVQSKLSQSPSQFAVSSASLFSTLFHSLTEKITVVNADSNSMVEMLGDEGNDVSCATTLQLDTGLRLLVTLDSYGQLLVYAWMIGDSDISPQPLARCQQTMRDVNYMCSFPGPKRNSFMIGVVNVYNRVALFCIDLSYIID